MKLRVQSISNRGNLERERLVLKVLADTDVGEYAVFRAHYANGSVTTGVTDVFWFPDDEVEAGDLVVLYSKVGVSRTRPIESGTAHFYYWGSDSPLWPNGKHSAVLLHVDEWASLNPED